MTDVPSIAIMSTISAKAALIELVPLFERESGCKIIMTYGGGPGLADRLRAGLAGDLFVGPDEFNEPLLQEGKLVAGSRVPFALSVSAVAIRAGFLRPDISTPDRFKATLLAAKSVSYSRGASGIQFVEALARLGIADAIEAKLVRPDPGELVGAVVARGGAEIGIQQVSELLPVSGIDIVGPLPGELQNRIVYAISVLSTSRQRHAGELFARFMHCEAARNVLKQKGLDPI
jgi:molybdate transport system substrate-binding protein